MVEHRPGYGCAQLLLCDKFRMTPFHLACENGDAQMVKWLLLELSLQVDAHIHYILLSYDCDCNLL